VRASELGALWEWGWGAAGSPGGDPQPRKALTQAELDRAMPDKKNALAIAQMPMTAHPSNGLQKPSSYAVLQHSHPSLNPPPPQTSPALPSSTSLVSVRNAHL
jgi:hypothetical protein